MKCFVMWSQSNIINMKVYLHIHIQ